jgi:hypothetical protein
MSGVEFQSLGMPGAILLLITALLLLTVQEWRLSLAIFAIQYLGVFLLTAIHWPVMMALSKLVAGWISATVLTLAISSSSTGLPGVRPRNLSIFRQGISVTIFKLGTAGMIVLVILTFSPSASKWVPGIGSEQVMGALFLLGLGLLNLGLTAVPFRVILALMTVLSGFEVIYSAVEFSTLVAGLLAGVNLGLAIIGAYLISAPGSMHPT